MKSDDLISQALSRVRSAAVISRSSRNGADPGNDKYLIDREFPVFPVFPGPPGNGWDLPVSTDRAGADAHAGAGAGARECDDASGNPGNPGNGRNNNDDPFPDFSRKESETGKSGKSSAGPLDLLVDIAGAVAPRREYDPTDLLAWWEERAAIREFDGGLDRDDAEQLAFGDVRAAIRNRWVGAP